MKRLTWYERQKKRKSSPFFRLLQRSFRFRLLLAAVISLSMLIAINRFETCHGKKDVYDCIFADFWAIISVGNVESFSIVTAALLYILESGRRKQKEHEEAAEIIRNNNATKVVHSIARIQAMELLNRAGFAVDEQDFERANLEQLEMPFGRIRRSNLANTVLIKADFRHANLTGTNLAHANLTEANLSNANLTDVDLTGANLTDANLKGANLTRTNFNEANLTRTQFDQGVIDQLPGRIN